MKSEKEALEMTYYNNWTFENKYWNDWNKAKQMSYN